MNKTAIKNFAIWARNKLIADISYRAGLMGITKDGIHAALPQSTGQTEFYDIGTAEPYAISGEAIRQRGPLVDLIQRKEKDTDYKTAYKYIIEEVAYTWFNRLIAVRFMEVNDYLPSHIRVLSSETGKIEPDLVTTPFDAELEFTNAEQQAIIELKNANKLDEVFRILFIKQCNALNEILPALFEKTNDYTELLLNLSVIDQDGVIYHLVHDIPEEDFDVERGGQVEIIGWLYQYYNTEPKNEAFAKKGKITKEEVPAVTQLFTPDWIVRYMVENSLGRLWVEGHPNDDLESGWKYYLAEAEQETEVEAQLAEIRAEYAKLNPEDIKVIDPCMGSGHILVYAFDVLMQIYESVGYGQRDAARSILENNLYGLDIDDRAFQIAYFAIMMKARQYNRRIFNRDYKPNFYSIQESNSINRNHLKFLGAGLNEQEKSKAITQMINLLELFKDAKEYGSILEVDPYDWNLLDRFVSNIEVNGQMSLETVGIDDTVEELKQLIAQGKVLERKYHITTTNPPYMASSGMDSCLTRYAKNNYPDSKADMFAIFFERCAMFTCQNGMYAMIVQPSILSLASFSKLRAKKLQTESIVSLIHMGRGIFGIDFGSTSYVFRKNRIKGYCAQFMRLHQRTFQFIEPDDIEKIYLNAKADKNYEYDFTQYSTDCGILNQEVVNPLDMLQIRFAAYPDEFMSVPNYPFTAYALPENVLALFKYPQIMNSVYFKEGITTANNDKFLRKWYEVEFDKIVFDGDLDTDNIYVPYNKGGAYRMWYGNHEYVVDWSYNGRKIRDYPGSSFRNASFQMKAGGTFSAISAGRFSARLSDEPFAFDSKGTMFFSSGNLKPIVAYMNSNLFYELLKIVCPTMDFRFGTIQQLPLLPFEYSCDKELSISKEDWDEKETSWNFRRHPLVNGEASVEVAYAKYETIALQRIKDMKVLMEQYNHDLLAKYGLEKTYSERIDNKDITLHIPNLLEDVKSLLSYAVGCMFGRYSLDETGLIFAGGRWESKRYHSYQPVEDNIILITDEEYLEDDIISRLCEWLKTAFDERYLEINLDFIAKGLKKKGKSSREIIRAYFIEDFYKEHYSMYYPGGKTNRAPIYWLFDSGKQNGFKALIYMHRYNANTIGNLRVDYLHRMQRVYESEISRMQDMIDHTTNAREVIQANKRREKLTKQLKECREYDEKLAHLALSRIELDLDDGVKKNYRKIQTAKDGKYYEVLSDTRIITGEK